MRDGKAVGRVLADHHQQHRLIGVEQCLRLGNGQRTGAGKFEIAGILAGNLGFDRGDLFARADRVVPGFFAGLHALAVVAAEQVGVKRLGRFELPAEIVALALQARDVAVALGEGCCDLGERGRGNAGRRQLRGLERLGAQRSGVVAALRR